MAAQGRWAEISGADRTHYCGAYWRWGFHEDGAWCALRADASGSAALERGRAGRSTARRAGDGAGGVR